MLRKINTAVSQLTIIPVNKSFIVFDSEVNEIKVCDWLTTLGSQFASSRENNILTANTHSTSWVYSYHDRHASPSDGTLLSMSYMLAQVVCSFHCITLRKPRKISMRYYGWCWLWNQMRRKSDLNFVCLWLFWYVPSLFVNWANTDLYC